MDLNLQIGKLEDTVPKLSYLRDAKLSAVSNQLDNSKLYFYYYMCVVIIIIISRNIYKKNNQ